VFFRKKSITEERVKLNEPEQREKGEKNMESGRVTEKERERMLDLVLLREIRALSAGKMIPVCPHQVKTILKHTLPPSLSLSPPLLLSLSIDLV